MTLILFYKNTIKTNAQKLKEDKIALKNSFRQNKPDSGQAQFNLSLAKGNMRILLHLYADLRGKDTSKIEVNPQTILEPKDLILVKERMQKEFALAYNPEKTYA